MGYGPIAVFTATMSSSATFSEAIDLHHGWSHLHLGVPTMASSSLYVTTSCDGETYYRIIQEIASTTVTVNETFRIDSSATQRCVSIPNPSARYIKIESTSGITDVITTFKILCT